MRCLKSNDKVRCSKESSGKFSSEVDMAKPDLKEGPKSYGVLRQHAGEIRTWNAVKSILNCRLVFFQIDGAVGFDKSDCRAMVGATVAIVSESGRYLVN